MTFLKAPYALLMLALFSSPARAEQHNVAVIRFVADGDARTTPFTVKVGETFGLQRLRAVKSAQMLIDVDVKTSWQTKALQMPKGTPLLYAEGLSREFYCGPYQPKKGGSFIAGSAWDSWLCFEDVDKDGVFDLGGFTDDNAMKLVPSFGWISNLYPVKLPYEIDQGADVFAYETAITYEGASSKSATFQFKIKRNGDQNWSSFILTDNKLKAGKLSLNLETLPVLTITDVGAFMVSARNGDELSVATAPAKTAVVSFANRYR